MFHHGLMRWSGRDYEIGVFKTCFHVQEENVRRKEQAVKRKAVETVALDAEKSGKAKRQRAWWEEEIAHGKHGAGGPGLDGDEVNDAEYFKEEVSTLTPRLCMPCWLVSQKAKLCCSRTVGLGKQFCGRIVSRQCR